MFINSDEAALAVKDLEKQLHIVTGNDLKHFNAAIDGATSALATFTTAMTQTPFAGGFGGAAGGGFARLSLRRAFH
jgi:hypothetical protein